MAIAPLLTIAAGVALAEGIREASGLSVTLKWPNDLYVGARKLGGILAEAGNSAVGHHHVVVGFGINLLPAAYPPDVAARATSLELELGRPVDRGLTLAACLAALFARYRELTTGGASAVLAAWRQYAAASLGRRVRAKGPTGVITGIAEDIDPSGALRVRTGAMVVSVISGEVVWE
jgi:BirA family biotin operon repressor/biotin-[acetyl-CoA-carboxylase] ligase